MAIEEPLQVGDCNGCRKINQQLDLPIILDESFMRLEQFKYLHADTQAWIINIRISKMGGSLRSLAIAEEAKAMGIPIIMGAQVGETSILTRAGTYPGWPIPRHSLGPGRGLRNYLLEHDITDTPFMCAAGGKLDPQSISGQAGPGLTLAQSA